MTSPMSGVPVKRPWTPDRRNEDGSITVTSKRCCNGCGRQLGDVSLIEIDAGIAGRPLPDVRGECPDCCPKHNAPPDLSKVEAVFRAMVEEYYRGCQRYAGAISDGPDSPIRLWWRIRLTVLADYGARLADALGQAEPDWRFMWQQAGAADPVTYATGPRGAFLAEPGDRP